MTEQSKAVNEMSSTTRNVSKQIRLIIGSSSEHAAASTALMGSLAEIRQLTDRNARGLKETVQATGRVTGQLVDLISTVDGLDGNAAAAKKGRNKKKGKKR
jgi:methyl-accepting chemotaxis protein